jgi:molybdopterin molybdotransferase
MVLAEDIISQDDIPPFDMAIIDGFALRSEDIVRSSQSSPTTLKLDGEVKVGCSWKDILQAGHSIKIVSGAPLPEGTDTIVSLEDAVRDNASRLKIYKYEKPGENIFVKGGDITVGTPVLMKGKTLTGADIGVLAAIGKNTVLCHRKPKVSFFASGNDLVAHDQPLQDGKVRAGNHVILQCQLTDYGAEPINLGIFGTDCDEVKSNIEKAMESDMFITSAGASMDDFDFIKGTLQKFGLDIKFWKVAIRPGKPMIFGTFKNKPVFGLPGNCLSSIVILEEFIRPAVMKMQGKKEIRRMEVVAKLDKDVKGGGGVTHFVRAEVRITENGFLAIPAGSRTSPSVMPFCAANGFIVVPQEINYFNSGDNVKVQIISEPANFF